MISCSKPALVPDLSRGLSRLRRGAETLICKGFGTSEGIRGTTGQRFPKRMNRFDVHMTTVIHRISVQEYIESTCPVVPLSRPVSRRSYGMTREKRKEKERSEGLEL